MSLKRSAPTSSWPQSSTRSGFRPKGALGIADAHMIVLAYLRDSETTYPSEIADARGLDVGLLQQLPDELVATGLAQRSPMVP